MPRLVVVLLATAGAVAMVASDAAGKGAVRVVLDAPQRCDAAPGSVITVAWTMASEDGQGEVRPFGASGVFVHLVRGHGRAPVKRHARQDRSGHYTVRVRVPAGGIRKIKVGLEGTTYTAGGAAQDADHYFPVTGDPCRRR
jgi:hypothetical protein